MFSVARYSIDFSETMLAGIGGFRVAALMHALTTAKVNHSAAICHRMSPTLKSTGVGHLGSKLLGCSAVMATSGFGRGTILVIIMASTCSIYVVVCFFFVEFVDI